MFSVKGIKLTQTNSLVPLQTLSQHSGVLQGGGVLRPSLKGTKAMKQAPAVGWIEVHPLSAVKHGSSFIMDTRDARSKSS